MINVPRAARALLLVTAVSSACSEAATPTAPTTTSTPGFTFASSFTAKGSATRSFTTGDTGAIDVTLTSVSPAVPLTISIGIPRADGAGCLITAAIETTAGTEPQLTVNAEHGTYCVRVADSGHVHETATFSVTVAHH